ncbi:MAG TPA: hypothetical protein VFY74_05695, partial [Methyloceanibacter sp.]|nr:hypothetical protein [Methyloceanibacter sp.]
AMIIERPFSVEGATRNILNQFAISLKNGPVGMRGIARSYPAARTTKFFDVREAPPPAVR